jgi:GH25 family lysozyme M1 (1,4-beta-N-acetylmuramidase)
MLQGVDVSNNQGPSIDWDAVAKAGISFAIFKRSEGLNFVDLCYDRNRSAAKAAGLLTGAYHFARPFNNAVAEAQFFLAHLPILDTGELVALDIEAGGGDLSAWALEWLDTVEKALGFPPLIYSYPAFINASLLAGQLANYPLWLADYSADGLANIGPWPFVALRQYTSSASVQGIPGNVDGDEIARDMRGLMRLGKPAPILPTWKVAISAALKQQPSHISAVAIGADHKPVPPLAVGTVVTPQGPVQVTDDKWQALKIPGGPIHGYYLEANLTT